MKIKSCCIIRQIINFILSFLDNITIQVVIDGHISKQHNINAGVPQRSILRPLSFLIFINDLPDNIVSEMGIFADDTELLYNMHEGRTNVRKSKTMAESLENDTPDR